MINQRDPVAFSAGFIEELNIEMDILQGDFIDVNGPLEVIEVGGFDGKVLDNEGKGEGVAGRVFDFEVVKGDKRGMKEKGIECGGGSES